MRHFAMAAPYHSPTQLKCPNCTTSVQWYSSCRAWKAQIFHWHIWKVKMEVNWKYLKCFHFCVHSNVELISKNTYVIDGDSFRPIQNPIEAKHTQITGNDCANPSITQEIVNGIVTIKIVFRRPNLSHTGPLSRLPIGCAMWAKLAANRWNHLLSAIYKKKISNRYTYTAMTFEWLSPKPFRLDSTLNKHQSTLELLSREKPQIRPNWKWSNFSPKLLEPFRTIGNETHKSE